MNENKICFITCYNDEALYQESLKYIEALELPFPFEIESLAVKGASSLTAGYNFAMVQSDAKYKVYLHQDVFIINKSFIKDLISLFQANEKLGIVGMVGSEKVPLNGVWWQGQSNWGKVYENHTGTMEQLSFQEVQGEYQSVQALDGFLLATQYDLPWREDVFDGWHFYDLSQCMEFIRAGYLAGVPAQGKCWAIHDCGIVNVQNGFDKYRKKFITTYGKDFFPLVSVLIPTYNRPEYLELALKSALNQTYPNIEIIISDDSTNDLSAKMLKPYIEQFPFIRYSKNKVPMVEKNFTHCFEIANGEYINFLMDDDLFAPNKISRMIEEFLTKKEIRLVTSYRKYIDGQGKELPDNTANSPIFDRDTLINGKVLGDLALENLFNFIGEPTTVLFRKSDVMEFGSFKAKNKYVVINDFATWLELLAKGNAVYLTEPLSYFRQHDGQNQRNPKFYYHAISNWYTLIQDARAEGFLDREQAYKNALKNYLKMSIGVLEFYEQINRTDILEQNQILLPIISALSEYTQPKAQKVNPNSNLKRRLAVIDTKFPWRLSGFRYWENLQIFNQRPDTLFFTIEPSSEEFPVPVRSIWEFEKFAESEGITDVYCVFLNHTLSLLGQVQDSNGNYIPGANPYASIKKVLEERNIKLHATIYPGGGLDPNTNREFLYMVGDNCATVFTNVNEVLETIQKSIFQPVVINTELFTYKPKLVSNQIEITFCAFNAIRKGFPILAEAFNRLPEQFHLNLIGDWEDHLNLLKNSRFTFYGLLPPEEIREIYERSHVFINCSIPDLFALDGFPTTAAVDAMATGCVLVSTNPRNDQLVLNENEHYFKVEPNGEALYKRLMWILDNLDQALEVGKNGAEIIKNKFNVKNIVDSKLKAIFDTV